MKKEAKQQHHIRRNSLWAILSAIAVVAICYNWLDLPIAGFFYLHPHPLFTEISCIYFKTLFQSNSWLLVNIVVLLFGGVFYISNRHKWARSCLFFACVGILAFLITGVIKVVLARYRPEAFFDSNLYGFHFFSTQWLYNSMPSGHATAAFANLMALAWLIRNTKVTIIFIIVAIFAAISRLICGEHYLSDVILGAYVGLLSVYWVQAFFARFFSAKQ